MATSAITRKMLRQFLHGLPYSIAPEVQKHVPMVSWLSQSFESREQLSVGCLRGTADTAYTHDNLYHSMLGLLDVKSPSYQPQLDLFGPCKAAHLASN